MSDKPWNSTHTERFTEWLTKQNILEASIGFFTVLGLFAIGYMYGSISRVHVFIILCIWVPFLSLMIGTISEGR